MASAGGKSEKQSKRRSARKAPYQKPIPEAVPAAAASEAKASQKPEAVPAAAASEAKASQKPTPLPSASIARSLERIEYHLGDKLSDIEDAITKANNTDILDKLAGAVCDTAVNVDEVNNTLQAILTTMNENGDKIAAAINTQTAALIDFMRNRSPAPTTAAVADSKAAGAASLAASGVKFEIRVNAPQQDGSTGSWITVSSRQTIREVKELISVEMKVPVNQQRLAHRRFGALQDRYTVGYYGIVACDIIEMTVAA